MTRKNTTKMLLLAGIILSIAFSSSLALTHLFDLGSAGISGFRVHSSDSLVTEQSQIIYENLSQPEIQLSQANIKQISVAHVVIEEEPFRQLSDIAQNPIVKLALLIVIFLPVASFISLRLLRHWRLVQAKWDYLVLVTTIISWVSIYFYICSKLSKGPWDEVFLLASQAKNFSEHLIWGVPISGSNSIAESSADTLVTIVAGTFLFFFPALQGETALVITYSLLVGLFSGIATLLLLKHFKFKLISAIGVVSLVLVFTPSAILSSAEGMPTSVAVCALAVYALLLFHSVSSGKYANWGLYSIVFSFVRWEYGLLATLTSIFLFVRLGVLLRNNKLPKSQTIRSAIWMIIPIFWFISLTFFRILLFQAAIPSGVSSKSVGIDGAYLSSGLNYLFNTASITQWPWIISVAIGAILYFSSRRLSSVSSPIIPLVFIFIPLLSSLLAGGDWFPQNWQRYILPSVSSISLIAFALLNTSKVKTYVRNAFILALAVVLVVAPTSVWLNVANGIAHPSAVQQRTNCLAKAGTILRDFVPEGQSVASAEVNTIAYFANRPVTDLIGLVDPRTANAPLAPREPGDLLHRRAKPELIQSDNPAVIYLWEGANCIDNAAGNYEELVAQDDVSIWNSLLNSSVTKYRIGRVDNILSEYVPVTIYVSGDLQLRFLLRKDLS